MSDSFHRARVEQQLRDANASLDHINAHLWEQDQPPEVRAALQERRARDGHAKQLGWRLVLGLAAAWVVASLLFGRAGQHAFAGLLGLLWDALNVLLVVGFFVGVGVALVRGARAITRFSRDRSAGDLS